MTIPASQNCSQEQILVKLQQYLDFKKKTLTNQRDKDNCVLPFSSAEGLCAGLSAYWLYCKRIGDEYEFDLAVRHILNWDPQDMGSLSTDAVIEDFMNAVAFLSFDTLLRTDDGVPGGIEQHNLEHSFKLLLPDEKRWPQVAAPEYKITFAFDLDNLAQILAMLPANKMVRINNMQHTVAFIKQDSEYVFYDPEAKTGAVSSQNPNETAAAILHNYKKFNTDGKQATLAISVYDLYGVEPGQYIHVTEYYNQWLSKPKYRDLCRNDTTVVKLSFWHGDHNLLSALIQNNAMDLNQELDVGITPLRYAIVEQNLQALFELLQAGADPNIAIGDASLWELAYYRNDANAMAMLLAFGYDVTAKELKLLNIYSERKIESIYDNALALNKLILRTPDILNLNTDNNADAIINYLQHAKLKYKLGKSQQLFNLQIDNNHYQGPTALRVLTEFYKFIEDSGVHVHEFSAKAEFYKLLKFFKAQQVSFKGSRELIAILDQIGKKIPKDPRKFDAEELLEISMMLNELKDICQNTKYTSLVKLRLVNKAARIQKKIQKLLNSSSIAVLPKAPRNYLFFASDAANQQQQQVSYRRDVLPLLRLNQ